jgi:hypothetical protein
MEKRPKDIPSWIIWALVALVILLIAAAIHGGAEAYRLARDWQTLATGILAIIAARWTIVEMQAARRQDEVRHRLQQIKEHQKERLDALPHWNEMYTALGNTVNALDDNARHGAANPAVMLDQSTSIKQNLRTLITDPLWTRRLEVLQIDDRWIRQARFRETNVAGALHVYALAVEAFNNGKAELEKVEAVRTDVQRATSALRETIIEALAPLHYKFLKDGAARQR